MPNSSQHSVDLDTATSYFRPTKSNSGPRLPQEVRKTLLDKFLSEKLDSYSTVLGRIASVFLNKAEMKEKHTPHIRDVLRDLDGSWNETVQFLQAFALAADNPWFHLFSLEDLVSFLLEKGMDNEAIECILISMVQVLSLYGVNGINEIILKRYLAESFNEETRGEAFREDSGARSGKALGRMAIGFPKMVYRLGPESQKFAGQRVLHPIFEEAIKLLLRGVAQCAETPPTEAFSPDFQFDAETTRALQQVFKKFFQTLRLIRDNFSQVPEEIRVVCKTVYDTLESLPYAPKYNREKIQVTQVDGSGDVVELHMCSVMIVGMCLIMRLYGSVWGDFYEQLILAGYYTGTERPKERDKLFEMIRENFHQLFRDRDLSHSLRRLLLHPEVQAQFKMSFEFPDAQTNENVYRLLGSPIFITVLHQLFLQGKKQLLNNAEALTQWLVEILNQHVCDAMGPMLQAPVGLLQEVFNGSRNGRELCDKLSKGLRQGLFYGDMSDALELFLKTASSLPDAAIFQALKQMIEGIDQGIQDTLKMTQSILSELSAQSEFKTQLRECCSALVKAEIDEQAFVLAVYELTLQTLNTFEALRFQEKLKPTLESQKGVRMDWNALYTLAISPSFKATFKEYSKNSKFLTALEFFVRAARHLNFECMTFFAMTFCEKVLFKPEEMGAQRFVNTKARVANPWNTMVASCASGPIDAALRFVAARQMLLKTEGEEISFDPNQHKEFKKALYAQAQQLGWNMMGETGDLAGLFATACLGVRGKEGWEGAMRSTLSSPEKKRRAAVGKNWKKNAQRNFPLNPDPFIPGYKAYETVQLKAFGEIEAATRQAVMDFLFSGNYAFSEEKIALSRALFLQSVVVGDLKGLKKIYGELKKIDFDHLMQLVVKDGGGYNAIYLAAFADQAEILNWLLKKFGIDLKRDSHDHDGCTPIMGAIIGGSHNALKGLLSYYQKKEKSFEEERNSYGETVIDVAVQVGDEEAKNLCAKSMKSLFRTGSTRNLVGQLKKIVHTDSNLSQESKGSSSSSEESPFKDSAFSKPSALGAAAKGKNISRMESNLSTGSTGSDKSLFGASLSGSEEELFPGVRFGRGSFEKEGAVKSSTSSSTTKILRSMPPGARTSLDGRSSPEVSPSPSPTPEETSDKLIETKPPLFISRLTGTRGHRAQSDAPLLPKPKAQPPTTAKPPH